MKRSVLAQLLNVAFLMVGAGVSPAIMRAGEIAAKRGAVEASLTSGWVFNLPGARAVALAGKSVADSGEHKSHIAPSAGVTVWASRLFGGYLDVAGIDGGKATAAVGGVKSEVSDSLVGLYGGVKAQYPSGAFRPYVDFGAGVLRESLTATFSAGSAVNTTKLSASGGSLRYGGGVRVFWGKHLGSIIGFEGYRFSSRGLVRNYPRVSVGLVWRIR